MTSKFKAQIKFPSDNEPKKPVVCNFCKSNKLRCNGSKPCSNCSSQGIECSIGYIDYKLPMRLNLDMKFFQPSNIKQSKKSKSQNNQLASKSNLQPISPEGSPPYTQQLITKVKMTPMSINKKPMKIIQVGPIRYNQNTPSNQQSQKAKQVINSVPPTASSSDLMFSLVRNIATKMPRSLFPKNTLVRLYPTGVFEVQGFSPMAFIITSASFFDHLSLQNHSDTKLFNPKSFSFQVQFPGPSKNHYFEFSDPRLQNVPMEKVIYHLSVIFFCRFHPTYPTVDPQHYFEKLDTYLSTKLDLSTGAQIAFHFLVQVICMIAGPMTSGFAHLHSYFEDSALDLVPKMYKIPHIYTCQGMFLLRSFQMSCRRASTKWMRYSDFAMRMCNSLGVFRGNPASFKNDPSLQRSRLLLAAIAQYTDLNVTSSTNTLPQLNSDMISLGMFSLPLNHPIFQLDCCTRSRDEGICPFNSLDSLHHVMSHDSIATKCMLQLTRFYYMSYVFNGTLIVHQLDNIHYQSQIFHQSSSLSSKIQQFYSLLPLQLKTHLIETHSWYQINFGNTSQYLNEKYSLLSDNNHLSPPPHVPILMKLPTVDMKFTCYLHCWYYFIHTTLYDKVSDYNKAWNTYFLAIPNLEPIPHSRPLDIREYCAFQNSLTAIRIIQIIMILGEQVNQYYISLKYLFLTRTCLTLSRLLISYNRKVKSLSTYQQRYFEPVTKFNLPRFYYNSKYDQPFDPVSILQYDQNIHECLLKPQLVIDCLKYGLYILHTSSEKWFIARESFNLLIGLLNQNDIQVVT